MNKTFILHMDAEKSADRLFEVFSTIAMQAERGDTGAAIRDVNGNKIGRWDIIDGTKTVLIK